MATDAFVGSDVALGIGVVVDACVDVAKFTGVSEGTLVDSVRGVFVGEARIVGDEVGCGKAAPSAVNRRQHPHNAVTIVPPMIDALAIGLEFQNLESDSTVCLGFRIGFVIAQVGATGNRADNLRHNEHPCYFIMWRMADSILVIETIVSSPGVMGGKPRIAGQRVSVANIAVLHEMHKWSADKIVDEFDLTLAQVYAALAYYYDHKTEIDRSIEEGDKAVREIGISAKEFKQKIESRRAGSQGR